MKVKTLDDLVTMVDDNYIRDLLISRDRPVLLIMSLDLVIYGADLLKRLIVFPPSATQRSLVAVATLPMSSIVNLIGVLLVALDIYSVLVVVIIGQAAALVPDFKRRHIGRLGHYVHSLKALGIVVCR